MRIQTLELPWSSDFHHHLQYDAKSFSFCHSSSSWHVEILNLTSFGSNLYGTQCPCFWVIPNAIEHFVTVVWSSANDSTSSIYVWHVVLRNNASNSLSFFWIQNVLIFNIKIFIIEVSKPIFACFCASPVHFLNE